MHFMRSEVNTLSSLHFAGSAAAPPPPVAREGGARGTAGSMRRGPEMTTDWVGAVGAVGAICDA